LANASERIRELESRLEKERQEVEAANAIATANADEQSKVALEQVAKLESELADQ
jgi:hypothetical protein